MGSQKTSGKVMHTRIRSPKITKSLSTPSPQTIQQFPSRASKISTDVHQPKSENQSTKLSKGSGFHLSQIAIASSNPSKPVSPKISIIPVGEQEKETTHSQIIQHNPLSISPKLSIQEHSSNLIQRKHLSISEAINNFKNTVTPTNEPTGSPTLVESGQFYWTKQISFAIIKEIQRLSPMLKEDPTKLPDDPHNLAAQQWQTLINWIKSVVDEWPHNQAAKWSQEIHRFINIIRNSSFTPPILIPLLAQFDPLLKPVAQQGKAIYYKLWGELNRTDAIPSLDQYRTLPALQSIWAWENQACGYTGSIVANRYTSKGGAKKANPDAKRRKSTAVWATFANSATRDMRKLSGDLRFGDVLNQTGVGSAVPKMKSALDDGWILHARVLSGIDYSWGEFVQAYDRQAAKGKPPKQPQPLGTPPQEHSIMIIGYDDANNEFVFWDPDSTASHRHGTGFGSLFFDGGSGRLSTAQNDAQLPVNDQGDHSRGDHRYQIILIGSQ